MSHKLLLVMIKRKPFYAVFLTEPLSNQMNGCFVISPSNHSKSSLLKIFKNTQTITTLQLEVTENYMKILRIKL